MKGYEMTAVAQQKVYVQRDWTDQELMADGFLSYRPVKRITMVRMLPPEEAPKTMKAAGNTITAEAGYWIAYVAGDALKETLDDYKPRPIEPDIFAETYRPWDEPNWQLTPTEAHLQRLAASPITKSPASGQNSWPKPGCGWKREPSLAPKGAWFCVGTGEPWSITEAWFQAHYLLPDVKIQLEVNDG
jgi:hypothetical protein